MSSFRNGNSSLKARGERDGQVAADGDGKWEADH